MAIFHGQLEKYKFKQVEDCVRCGDTRMSCNDAFTFSSSSNNGNGNADDQVLNDAQTGKEPIDDVK